MHLFIELVNCAPIAFSQWKDKSLNKTYFAYIVVYFQLEVVTTTLEYGWSSYSQCNCFFFLYFVAYLSYHEKVINALYELVLELPAICLSHQDGGIALCTFPNGTSKLAGFFSTLSLQCWTSSREAVNTNFEVIGLPRLGIKPSLQLPSWTLSSLGHLSCFDVICRFVSWVIKSISLA